MVSFKEGKMKQFAVIGLGRFGASVAVTLAEKKQQVLAIDSNEEFVHDIMDQFWLCTSVWNSRFSLVVVSF